MSTSTLFLDFDGVLHSMSGYRDQPFCRLPLLEEVLVNTDVDIVISSSWRFQYSLDELAGKLGRLGLKCRRLTSSDAASATEKSVPEQATIRKSRHS